MKCYSILTLLLCLTSLGIAAPTSGSPKGSNGNDPQKPDKGKGRASSPSPPNSRPNTPTPEHDSKVPLPGRSGIHTDDQAGIATMYYGDDNMPGHMGHLQRNLAAFPHNRNPMGPTRPNDKNRQFALANVPSAQPHPVTGEPRVRDEKMLQMLHNPHHSTSTTVEYLPEQESRA